MKRIFASPLDLLELANLGVDYADVRLEDTRETQITFQNGELLVCQELPSVGAFLRVHHRGRWHQRATTRVGDLAGEFAALIAAAARAPQGAQPPPLTRAARDSAFTPYEQSNCTHATLAEKLAFTRNLLVVPTAVRQVVEHSLSYKDRYRRKWFLASDGVRHVTDYNQAGVRLSISLKDGEKIFDDTINTWFMSPLGQTEIVAAKLRQELAEALLFLNAETIVPGKYPTLLSPLVTGVFTHESFGHKSEADFMLGDEAMLREWTMGKVVAAAHVSIVDEGDSFGTSGYAPVDDEGNRKTKTYLIKDGKLAGRLHSADTARALGEANTGNGRAMNFEYPPIVRMTNTYIEPGPLTRDELIRDVKQGVYIKDFKHGMGMSTFTIAPSKAWWIENGKITRPVRVSVISGSVFETLMNIKGVARDFEVVSSAFGGCGKNDQWPLPVADGGPSILVEGMQVS